MNKNKPNILLIMTDQQNAKMMSCTGNKWLKTPALDSLAREGIRFENAYCTNPECVPSRISIATGVMPGILGVDNNRIGLNLEKLPAQIENRTLGKLLKKAGYDTFYGGKVHMCKSLLPERSGYDEIHKDSRGKLPDECLKFMIKKRKKPFFAVASFINPHDICFAHIATKGINKHNMLKRYQNASSIPLNKLPPLPENFELPINEPSAIANRITKKANTPSTVMREVYDERAWRIYRWMYHRLTEKVDTHIDKILMGIKEAGLEDNTLIIFTSDHGEMDASHKLASKGVFYDESIGVPFVMKFKGKIPPGKVEKTTLVSTGLDILPTISDYAGINTPKYIIGESLRPYAEGKLVNKKRRYIVSENGWGKMLRTNEYKYCNFNHTKEEFLVDLKIDPGEMSNIANDIHYKDTLEEYRRLLSEWYQTFPVILTPVPLSLL